MKPLCLHWCTRQPSVQWFFFRSLLKWDFVVCEVPKAGSSTGIPLEVRRIAFLRFFCALNAMNFGIITPDRALW